ncbi:MFS general substrate transporter [Sarocladium strictum]
MNLEDGVVGWEDEDDPKHPQNFSPTRKWLITALLSALAFLTPFASSIIAPAIKYIAEDFGVSDITLSAMPVSIFLLGYAIGPLFLSPLSEIYGRRTTMMASHLIFCLFLIACALSPSISLLIFFRFVCGVGGSASQTVGGAVIADLFPVSERGHAMSFWILGPILGPSLAPLVGGFLAESIGWRWAHWITLIPAGVLLVAMVLAYPETHHEVLIQQKTKELASALDRPGLRNCYADATEKATSSTDTIIIGLTRPLKLLFSSTIIFGVSLYVAFSYGCLYLLFNTIPTVYLGSYSWSTGISGIVYLALLFGYLVGLLAFSLLSDKTVRHMTSANGGVYEAEMRLPFCVYFAGLLPISFFLYGWSADQAVHWAVPTLGLAIFGIGFEGIWLPTQIYIVDAYSRYAASALAAFCVMRSVVAAFLPLAGPIMYKKLGIGWGNSVLGFISLAMVPIPVLICKFGGRLRRNEKLQL